MWLTRLQLFLGNDVRMDLAGMTAGKESKSKPTRPMWQTGTTGTPSADSVRYVN
jgi:hypothetical protein